MLQPGDALVLLGNGVYAAIEGSAAFSALVETGVKIYLLHPDATAAGITCAAPLKDIDMEGLVTLTEQFPRQLAWY